MPVSYDVIEKTAHDLRTRLLDFVPDILLILGSGLGVLAEQVDDPIVIPYSELSNFPRSTAPGHAGCFVAGTLAGARVLMMRGRFHFYEGYDMDTLTLPVRVAASLGVKTMIVTNASGGVDPSLNPGDILCIDDHIKWFDISPLRGPNPDKLGDRFPDMTAAYDKSLRTLADQVADQLGIPLRHGVYIYFPGPQFETSAEVRAARILGADVVGMSTVPEVIVARHAGLRVLGLSVVCNKAAGSVAGELLSGQEVLEQADAAKEPFSKLVLGCLGEMAGLTTA